MAQPCISFSKTEHKQFRKQFRKQNVVSFLLICPSYVIIIVSYMRAYKTRKALKTKEKPRISTDTGLLFHGCGRGT